MLEDIEVRIKTLASELRGLDPWDEATEYKAKYSEMTQLQTQLAYHRR